MALWSTQPLTETNTRNLPGGKGRPARKADNLIAICERDCLENVRASTSHTPMGLHGMLQGQLYLFSFTITECYTRGCGALSYSGGPRFKSVGPELASLRSRGFLLVVIGKFSDSTLN
jgi:hypothetical protein